MDRAREMKQDGQGLGESCFISLEEEYSTLLVDAFNVKMGFMQQGSRNSFPLPS